MGRRLRVIREVLELTQEDFAEVAGVGWTTVSGWEVGRNRIDIVKLAKLAERYGFSANYIVLNDLGSLRHDIAVKVQERLASEFQVSASKRGRPSKRDRAA